MEDVVAMTGGAVGQDAIARLEVRPRSKWLLRSLLKQWLTILDAGRLACNESLSSVSCRSVIAALEEAGLC